MTFDRHTRTWEFLSAAATFAGDAEQVEQLAKQYSRDEFLSVFGLVRDKKEEFCNRFRKDQMVNIVKATTLIEEFDRKTYLTGSVHPAILIIRLLRDESREECGKLDEWVIQNSSNDWLPWGKTRGWAKTFEELEGLEPGGVEMTTRTNAAQEAEPQEQGYVSQQEQDMAAKLERDKAKAQHNIYNAIRRKDLKAIEAMIAKGADVDCPNDEGKTPRAYAEELGEEKVLGVLG